MAINIIVVDYFHNLFTSSNPDSIDEVVQSVDAVVMQDMNDSLMQPFSSKEIRRALFQISPSKALGQDGMIALFFQKYWHIVGVDVTLAILDFLNSGRMLGSINFINIALNPK